MKNTDSFSFRPLHNTEMWCARNTKGDQGFPLCE